MEFWRFCGNSLKFLLGLSMALGGLLLGVFLLSHIHLSANQIFTACGLVVLIGVAVNWAMKRCH